MTEFPSDPLHHPKFVSKFFPFGVALLAIGFVALLVRLILIPAGAPAILEARKPIAF
jgi:hypothetical protein